MQKYRTHNYKTIIKPVTLVTTLENGIVIQETRGKKAILTAVVVLTTADSGVKKGDWVWYPEYSALPITLDNEQLYVIDNSDIILSKEKEECQKTE